VSRRVVIIGAGIAGLSAAYELGRTDSDWELVLLEIAPRIGGRILTDRLQGIVVEGGPDCFVTNKPWAMRLISELGMEDELVATNDRDKSVFCFSRGRLRRFPEGLMLMAPTKVVPFLLSDIVPWPAKLRMGAEYLIPRGGAVKDESLGEFALRRFGREALETIVGPVLAGIHAGEPERLSLRSTFPQFADMERDYRSILIGMRALARKRAQVPRRSGKPRTLFMTLRGGLNRLTDVLQGHLPSGSLRLDCGAASVERIAAGRFLLRLTDGTAIEADAVVSAAPADAAAKSLTAFPGLCEELGAIEFASTATASLLFEAEGASPRLDGFGFVVDRRADRRIMAATYTSTKFPGRVPEGKLLIRCFLGGVGREKDLEGGDADILARTRDELRGMVGISQAPLDAKVYRWPGANPQYNIGHGARLVRLEERVAALPGLILVGSSYRGVGIPECIRSGRDAARHILQAGAGVPAGAVL